MINLEVKGTLAKLLATEDLLVEHRNVSTASFNVQTRVLTLPLWEKATSEVFDLLIAHEVGHALFTPNEDWRERTSVPMGFLNVVEDARIENLMKQKYGGLPKTFYRGYKTLFEEDFFSLEEGDVNEMNIADRANLYFKVGNFVSIDFTAAELAVIKQIAAARTFDETIAASEALYALHKEQKENEPEEQPEEQSSSPEGQEEQSQKQTDAGDEGRSETPDFELPELPNIGDMENDTEGEGKESGEGDESDDGEEETEEEFGGGGNHFDSENDTVKTMDNLDESLKSLASTSSWSQPEYVSYPKINLKNTVASNSEIHDYINSSFAKQRAHYEEHCPNTYQEIIYRAFGCMEEKYAKFKREIQSEVNYMVKEFECKKSAAAYSRATTSRTGTLDCTKLHTYKYNDDIFKKITSIPEGKNHGLVFVLDWSGSMCDILEATMKQLLSLVMFCDKVGIPFDVYAFTNEWSSDFDRNIKEELQPNTIHLGRDFTMMNILTSNVNRKELQRQMQTMFVIASSYSSRSFDIVPRRVGLSGTPLNEALVTIREILPQFKTNKGVEKAHVMILTDGEAAQSRVAKMQPVYTGGEELRITRLYSNNLYLRNRKTGTIRKVSTYMNPTQSLTTSLIEDLKNEFPESSFTGFRILESRGGWFVRSAMNGNSKLQSQWKKDKSVALTGYGYDKYYIVSSNALQESADFDVAEDASKAKIKTAFAKSLKSKKNNKKILGDFIGLIA